ncbi:hypothetical protein N431DRAFT_541859 [Stipitochalara longipes BDJ]|nr:hypothetical protein N431DRAFT_541859 [Stipitochalara longipes BDJ]
MDFDIAGPEQALAPPQKPQQKPQKGPILSRNDRKWESLKQEIQRVYMTENRTLPQTMLKIEQAHGFKASPRKWKDKLKEWGFEKNLSESDMRIVVAKVDKRKMAGKETSVFLNGVQMPTTKIDNFKRRKTVRESDPASPSASTPGPVTYSTPHFDLEMSSTSEMEETAELDDNFTNLEISPRASSARPQPVDLNVAQIEGTNHDTSRTTSQLLLPLESHHLWTNIPALNSINELTSEVAADFVSVGDSPRTVTSEGTLSPSIGSSTSEDLVSSQLPNIGERDRAKDEHYERDKLHRTTSNGPQALPSDHQEIAEVPYYESPMASENDTAASRAPSMPLAAAPEEYNLLMLSKAVDECFEGGFELDLTITQLLSIFTYLQGPPLEGEEPPVWFKSYWETKKVAALARTYIEMPASFAAVSIFMRVVTHAWVILGGEHHPEFMLRLERTLPFSRIVTGQSYLNHEFAVLRIVLACYFKYQLASEDPSLSSSRRILGVVERLRYIQATKDSANGNILNQILQGLITLLRSAGNWDIERKGQFRDELSSFALHLAINHSQRKELEIAKSLFQGYEEYHYQRYEEHQYRHHHWQNGLHTPRVRAWNTETQSLGIDSRVELDPAKSADLDSQIKGFCQILLNLYTHARNLDSPIQAKGVEVSNVDAAT